MNILNFIIFGFTLIVSSTLGFLALYLGIEYHLGNGTGFNAIIAGPMVFFSLYVILRSIKELLSSL